MRVHRTSDHWPVASDTAQGRAVDVRGVAQRASGTDTMPIGFDRAPVGANGVRLHCNALCVQSGSVIRWLGSFLRALAHRAAFDHVLSGQLPALL